MDSAIVAHFTTPHSDTDSEIIELFRVRAERALDVTSKKYGKYCTKIAMNILHDRGEAEECLSDTLLAAWNSIPPQNPASLGAYLSKISRNLAFDRYRTKNRKKRLGDNMPVLLSELEECLPSGNDVETEVDASETAQSIARFLDTLEGEQRAVFIRRYWYSEPISDISARYGMSKSKVKSMLFRVRNKLKEFLEKEGVLV